MIALELSEAVYQQRFRNSRSVIINQFKTLNNLEMSLESYNSFFKRLYKKNTCMWPEAKPHDLLE